MKGEKKNEKEKALEKKNGYDFRQLCGKLSALLTIKSPCQYMRDLMPLSVGTSSSRKALYSNSCKKRKEKSPLYLDLVLEMPTRLHPRCPVPKLFHLIFNFFHEFVSEFNYT